MLLMFNFEQISHFALVFALLDFEPVNVGWVCNNKLLQKMLKHWQKRNNGVKWVKSAALQKPFTL